MSEIKKFVKSLNTYRWIRKTLYPLEKKVAKIDSSFPKEIGVRDNGTIKVAISLTSFPARIDYVSKTICSLLHQSYKPDKVLLYLSSSQFKECGKEIPKELIELEKYGLSIRWVSGDIRSYKKLIPAMIEYPNYIIVTADDDLYYPTYWLQALMNSYEEEPKRIHCHLVTKVFLRKNSFVFKDCYRRRGKGISSYNFKILGGSGALYPPGTLHPDVLNKDIFMRYATTNDDIWFWVMAIRNNTKIRWIKHNMKRLYYVEGTQEKTPCLYSNNNNGPNYRLKQMVDLFEMYNISFD